MAEVLEFPELGEGHRVAQVDVPRDVGSTPIFARRAARHRGVP